MTSPVQQGCIFSSDRTRVLAVDISSSSSTEESVPAIATTTTASSNTSLFNMLTPPASKSDVVEPKEFNVTILQKKWPEARLYPTPTDDGQSRIFIDIQDLATCGVFSGDWVLVSANDPKKSRLCRVYGIDSNHRQE